MAPFGGREFRKPELRKVSDVEWEIGSDFKPGMRVPARVIATQKLINEMDLQVYDQITNVATLPGIIRHAYCMPDGHSGYGFPIGGVAAMDLEGGVISPGGIGFDINCLAGSTRVLTEHGCTRSIRELVEERAHEELPCINTRKKREELARIALFLKKAPDGKKVFRLTTRTGRTIVATGDHPLLTPSGMKPVRDLSFGGSVAVFPFQGVEYERPPSFAIASEHDIKCIDTALDKQAAVKELKDKGLLPLRADSPALPYLIKLLAYNMGDGTLYENGRKSFTAFYGQRGDLERMRKDLKKIGFTPTRVYSRRRSHRIDTRYGRVSFTAVENSFYVSSRGLYLLLRAMGAPAGRKATQAYVLPAWLFRLPLWLKRLFLASYFGAEMSAPKTMTGHSHTFYMPAVSVNKAEALEGNARKFLNQLASLLSEFGVKSAEPAYVDDYKSARGERTVRLRLAIDGTPENLIALYEKIGFEYHAKKRAQANLAAHYLRCKQCLIRQREKAAALAMEMRETGISVKEIAHALEPYEVNERFVLRSIYEGRASAPRIGNEAQSFEEFRKRATRGLGASGAAWDRIERIEEIEFGEEVYDFTLAHASHDFIANGLVVSNCGMRLCLTNLTLDDVKPKLKQLVDELFRRVPAGVGCTGFVKLSKNEFREVIERGAQWCVEKGYGWKEDLERTEEDGCIQGADAGKVSAKAIDRGFNQIGTLGSGNHYLEIQVAKPEAVYDEKTAKAFGITLPNQIVVMFHCGSRGFGHQVASDYLELFLRVMEKKYGIKILDRELASAPFNSPEGQDYFAAMKCAVNMSFANRQVILHRIREVFSSVFGRDAESLGLHQVYDVAHNIAKIEEHTVNGERKKVLVHRKGATRSFGPGREEIPPVYRAIGQPVIIGGSMETGSYVLLGTKTAEEKTWGSTAHGSGRSMSRTKAKHLFRGDQLQKDLAGRGIYIRSVSFAGLAEEAGAAYKSIDEVIEATHLAGISTKVVRLVPIGNVKG
ncbi:MAG: intein-containing RctB family protein [Candidatus Micrarchaeia archaeon]